MLMLRIPEKAKKFFKDGCLVIDNKTVKLVEDFYLESYHHEWQPEMRSFEYSGIEVETADEYSTIVLLTLLNNISAKYTLKRDATAFAEITTTLNDFLKVINLIKKLNIKLVSTHIHSSSPLVYYLLCEYASSYAIISSYLRPDQARKIFGRKFNRYADDNLSWWCRHRNGMITYPRMTWTPDKIFIDLPTGSDRPTVEFRLPKLQCKTTTKRFLLFLILWYLYETRFHNDYLRQPLWKAVETVSKINTKTLSKISLDKLIQKIKKLEVEVLSRYTFYFHVRGRAPFNPNFLR